MEHPSMVGHMALGLHQESKPLAWGYTAWHGGLGDPQHPDTPMACDPHCGLATPMACDPPDPS